MTQEKERAEFTAKVEFWSRCLSHIERKRPNQNTPVLRRFKALLQRIACEKIPDWLALSVDPSDEDLYDKVSHLQIAARQELGFISVPGVSIAELEAQYAYVS